MPCATCIQCFHACFMWLHAWHDMLVTGRLLSDIIKRQDLQQFFRFSWLFHRREATKRFKKIFQLLISNPDIFLSCLHELPLY